MAHQHPMRAHTAQPTARRLANDSPALTAATVLLAACAMLLTVGCQPTDHPAAPVAGKSAALTELDPCADRLHDICGELLLHYLAHGELPQQLSELRGGKLPVTCPVTIEPYDYHRDGLPIPGSDRVVLVSDPRPHSPSARWAIVADPPRPGKPLVARVLKLAETPVFTPKMP